MLTCPVCGKRSCGCGPGSPITFTYHDGTGPGKQGWQSAVRELDPSDSPVVLFAAYELLQSTLEDTNEALAACQSQAAGRIRELEEVVAEALGCFTAAVTEGLHERIAEMPKGDTGSLFDLLTRRVLYAHQCLEAYSRLNRDESPPCNCGYGCPPQQGCRHP
jgi:hypothetical protein